MEGMVVAVTPMRIDAPDIIEIVMERGGRKGSRNLAVLACERVLERGSCLFTCVAVRARSDDDAAGSNHRCDSADDLSHVHRARR